MQLLAGHLIFFCKAGEEVRCQHFDDAPGRLSAGAALEAVLHCDALWRPNSLHRRGVLDHEDRHFSCSTSSHERAAPEAVLDYNAPGRPHGLQRRGILDHEHRNEHRKVTCFAGQEYAAAEGQPLKLYSTATATL